MEEREAREDTGLPIVIEVLDPRLAEPGSEYADVIQSRPRSMPVFPLLTGVGLLGRPVLLKRGFGATVEDWVNAAVHPAVGGSLDTLR